MNIKLMMLLGFSCVAVAPPVIAEQFNFTVPVSINNLPPEINEFSVTCVVNSGPSATHVLPNLTLGAKQVTLPISGSFHDDVVIHLDVNAGYDPHDAKQYSCSLPDLRINPPPPGSTGFYHPGVTGDRFPLAPGAPVVVWTLPQTLP